MIRGSKANIPDHPIPADLGEGRVNPDLVVVLEHDALLVGVIDAGDPSGSCRRKAGKSKLKIRTQLRGNNLIPAGCEELEDHPSLLGVIHSHGNPVCSPRKPNAAQFPVAIEGRGEIDLPGVGCLRGRFDGVDFYRKWRFGYLFLLRNVAETRCA